jgi:7-carboxy-7-deazaguanine synthase
VAIRAFKGGFRMRILEIFQSIQGEGPAMGRPATFVRLAGCNLRCEGCDTPLAIGRELAPAEVAEGIPEGRVVITGGEPALQGDELSRLVDQLCQRGLELNLETNGTIPLPDEILSKFRYVVVSPKQGSAVDLDRWSKRDNVHIKFVMGPRPWCWSADKLAEVVPSLPRDRVWIMPFGADPEMKEARKVWDLALRLNVNYSDRLHIRVGRR